jgi:hypothetical protein
MNVREYAAQLLALPEDVLELQVVREGHNGCFEFVSSPEAHDLSAWDASGLASSSSLLLTPDDVKRVMMLG